MKTYTLETKPESFTYQLTHCIRQGRVRLSVLRGYLLAHQEMLKTIEDEKMPVAEEPVKE